MFDPASLRVAKWTQYTDRQIAKIYGCSHPLVGQIRNPKPVENNTPAAVGGNFTVPGDSENQVNEARPCVSTVLAATKIATPEVELDVVGAPEYTRGGAGRRWSGCRDGLAAPDAHFDTVLMDIQMPVMDGYTATYQIREVLGLLDLTIIAMTGHACPQDREKFRLAGMAGIWSNRSR